VQSEAEPSTSYGGSPLPKHVALRLIEAEDNEDDHILESLTDWLDKLQLDPLHPRQSTGNTTNVGKIVSLAMATNLEAWMKVKEAKRPEFWKVHPVRFSFKVLIFSW
jgi:hypothetical protein